MSNLKINSSKKRRRLDIMSFSDKKKNLEPINIRSNNLLDRIENKYNEDNLKPVELTEIKPLLNNTDFLDLIITKGIPFTSAKNKELSDSLSKVLQYIANKKSFIMIDNQHLSKNADEFALKIKPILEGLDKQGYKTLQSKADKLNTDGIKTARDKTWHIASIRRIQKRLEELDTPKISQSLKKPKP